MTNPSPTDPPADGRTFRVAMIHDVFHDDAGPERLARRLEEARDGGATLAILPEIPLNPWSPATKRAREDDAEAPGGPRFGIQAEAAARAGVGLVGGAIVRGDEDGIRRNTAFVIGTDGSLLGTWTKAHVPEEPGFWETSHYDPGDDAIRPFEGFPRPIGVQICSDVNRPEGCHLLAAMGAALVANPRATERATYERWRVVFRANAITSRCYLLSVNRPEPEGGVEMGGPSIAVAPRGEVLIETEQPVSVVEIQPTALAHAAVAYPGYLPVRASMYAEGWSRVAAGGGA